MKYTVIITERKDGEIRATVPGIPECHVHAKTRNDAIHAIREAIADFITQSEILQLDVAAEPKSGSIPCDTPWEFFGAFEHDAMWGVLFDDIEHRRNTEKTP